MTSTIDMPYPASTAKYDAIASFLKKTNVLGDNNKSSKKKIIPVRGLRKDIPEQLVYKY